MEKIYFNKATEFYEIDRFGKEILERIEREGKEKTNIGIRAKIRFQLHMNNLNRDRYYGIERDAKGVVIRHNITCGSKRDGKITMNQFLTK